jgi:hypothetical protein
MFDIISFFTIRTVILLFSTTFSILLVMLLLNIVTVDEIITILNLSDDSANALRAIVERFREVSHNALDILSQLLTKLFSWAGIEIDLSKIQVDLNQNNSSDTSSANPNR